MVIQPKSVDGTSGGREADDLESLEQNYTSTGKHNNSDILSLNVKGWLLLHIPVLLGIGKNMYLYLI